MPDLFYSFVIPAKNEEFRLPRSIESIRAQGEDDLIEVIVVDNGSTDRTMEVAEGLGATVFQRLGDTVAGLRNFGAGKARGEVLVFIDADVAVAPDFLKAAQRHLSNHSVGIVTGRILVPEDGTWVEKTWFLNRLGNEKVRETDWSSSMNMIVKKEVFHRAGGFTATLVTCEDVDFSRKVREAGFKIAYDPALKVTHFGEAKDLGQLFRKERWRGASALELLRQHPRDFHRWASFLQFPFFLGAALGSVLFAVAGKPSQALAAVALLNLLPLLRSVIISRKSGTARDFFPLYLVWTVYYAARGVALMDRLLPLRR